MKCKQCKNEIKGEYLKVGSDTFHKGCFLCAKCNKLITEGFQILNGKYYHKECYKEKAGLVCTYCKKNLEDKWIVSDGKRYHEKCFRENVAPKCAICNKTIDGEYVNDDGGIYHKECFKREKLFKCDICGYPIDGKYTVDFWGNRVHDMHGMSKTLLCDCCGRAISERTSKGGVKTADGRPICGICKNDLVTTSTRIYEIKKEIDVLFKKIGIVIPEIKEITQVDKAQIKKMSGADNNLGFAETLKMVRGKAVISIEHRIYILHSFQRVKFAGVLAHEMLHAWLNQNHVDRTKKEMEGFCNLGSYLVYQNSKEEIAKYLMKQMEEDKDPIYGDGYRKMKKELDKLGWEDLIKRFLG